MKLNKTALKKLIKEEIENLTEEESIESMKDKIASDIEGMEYQDAMRHLKRMFRAMQNVMLDITPGVPDSDEMEMEDEEVVMEQDDKQQKELINAIKGLSKKFDELDLSIDFLAAVMSQSDPLSIGMKQTVKGRYSQPTRRK